MSANKLTVEELKKQLEEANAKAENAEQRASESEAELNKAKEKLEQVKAAEKTAEIHASKAEALELERRKTEAKVTIIIAEGSGPGGQDEVLVGVNGVESQIKRNVEVEVPRSVLNVLNDAITIEYNQDDDGRIIGNREVPRYNVRVIK